jgi:hypothetical protein
MLAVFKNGMFLKIWFATIGFNAIIPLKTLGHVS